MLLTSKVLHNCKSTINFIMAKKRKRPGKTGLYNKDFDTAARVLINRYRKEGKQWIEIQDLYTDTGADTRSDKISVLWAVRGAKDAGILKRVYIKGKKQWGLYEVVA